MQAAFEVAEQDRHCLNALFIGEVLDALFLNLVGGNARFALFLGFQVELFELGIREHQKIT